MNIREDIKAYIDGELSEARAVQVRQAIESDPSLREEYEGMKSLSATLQGLARAPVVRGAEKAMQASRGGIRPWATALVGVGVVVVLGAILFPVFAQSKDSARRSAAMSDAKQKAMTSRGEAADLSVDGGVVSSSPQVGGVPEFSTGEKAEWLQNSQTGGGRSGGATPPEVMGYPKAQSPSERYLLPDARLVIKNASFNIEVEDVQATMDKATHLTKAMGGFIESSNKSELDSKAQGFMTIRVPEAKFESAVEQIRGYGEVKGESATGDDVTAQVADIDARIKTLKSEEESYREILRQARKIGDILDIKERIGQVRQEIESLMAQQATLRKLSALSTINLEFRESQKTTDEPKPDDWFEETNVSAVLVLKAIGKFFAQIGIYLVRLAPIWIPVAVIVYWWRKRGLAV